jgi:hypothetical protein
MADAFNSAMVVACSSTFRCSFRNSFSTILLAATHCFAGGQLVTADLAPVLEVTFDSAPTIRSKVFRSLLEQNGTLKTSQVEKLLRCSKPTALKEMEALAVLAVADKTEADTAYGRPEHELRLAEKFQWLATDECKGLRWL